MKILRLMGVSLLGKAYLFLPKSCFSLSRRSLFLIDTWHRLLVRFVGRSPQRSARQLLQRSPVYSCGNCRRNWSPRQSPRVYTTGNRSAQLSRRPVAATIAPCIHGIKGSSSRSSINNEYNGHCAGADDIEKPKGYYSDWSKSCTHWALLSDSEQICLLATGTVVNILCRQTDKNWHNVCFVHSDSMFSSSTTQFTTHTKD